MQAGYEVPSNAKIQAANRPHLIPLDIGKKIGRTMLETMYARIQVKH